MFELKTKEGYVMWSIHDAIVERQCIVYNDNGTELDMLDVDDDTFIKRIVSFSILVAHGLQTVGEVERSIYLNHLPSLLQLAKCYTNVLST